MKFVRETAPYIRKGANVKRMMIDVLIALLPVTLFALIQNGWNSGYVILTSVVSMLLIELLVIMIIKWPREMKFKELFTKIGFNKLKEQYTINNFLAPIISGIIYAMIMPAGAPVYVVLIGAVSGMLIGKMVFGGLGSNIFNPAAVGRIIVGVCFSLTYVNGGVDVISGGTPLTQITGVLDSGISALTNFNFAIAQYSIKDLFFGNVPGCMGEVSALMIIIGGVYLIIRRSADFRSMFATIISFVIVNVVIGVILNNKLGINTTDFVLYQLLSGGLLFGAIFMVTDPVTSPTTKFGRILFGTIVGVLAATIRLIGATPEGVAFAILIANMFVPVIDQFSRKSAKYSWKQAVGITLAMVVMCLVLGFTIAGRV